MTACFCTPAQDLLNTIDPVPTTHDCIQRSRNRTPPSLDVNASMIETQTNLNCIENAIRQMKDLERRLEGKRVQLLALAEAQASTKALIRRLDDNVLGLIFEWYGREVFKSAPTKPVDAPPLSLASVCHRWRQHAFADSRLWTALRVCLDTMRSEDLPRLRIVIDASQSLPLDLTLLLPQTPNWSYSDLFSPAGQVGFGALMNEAHCWSIVRSLTTTQNSEDLLIRMSNHTCYWFKNPFPKLVSVDWRRDGTNRAWRGQLLHPFAVSEALEKLTIPMIHPKGEPNIHFPSLRELHVDTHFSSDTLAHLVRLLPALEVFSVAEILTPDEESQTRIPIVQPACLANPSEMRRLTLGRIEGRAASFLQGAVLPKLEYLNISGSCGWGGPTETEPIQLYLSLAEQSPVFAELVLQYFTHKGQEMLESSLSDSVRVTVEHEDDV